jgi:CO/xanthine dehydrogenase FAD-binding subunit
MNLARRSEQCRQERKKAGVGTLARYARPHSLDEALGLRASGRWRAIAGGTDFYPAQGANPLTDDVLDLTAIGALRGIGQDAGGFRIGAATTWTDVLRADLPQAFDALRQAAREVGSVQVQNRATLAGNLCNASPAADGVPPLLALDAELEIASVRGVRRQPLSGFILGNRKTGLGADELVTAIHVPAQSASGRSAFMKLGARRYLVISIAMVAARIATDAKGRVREAAVAVGACSAVAMRLPQLERELVGRQADATLAGIVEPRHLEDLSPIDDVRASAAYRREAAREIVARALAAAVESPAAEAAA